jgi:hypothetical protein
MRLDSSGNLGLGVTPSAWGSGRKAIQIGATSALFSPASGTTLLAENSYVNTSLQDIYLTSAAASSFRLQSGGFQWFTAPSGTAGNAISFTQAMTLDASGNLLVGATSTVDAAKLYVVGTISNAGTQFNFRPGTSTQYEFVNRVGAGFDFYVNNAATLAARITATGSFVAGAQAALATTATDGFLYVPTCAGTPTGVPTAITGMAPIVVNTTNNKLYFYSGGAWRDAGP